MTTLLSASMRVRWAAIGAAVAVTFGAGALGVAHATLSSGERAVFVPIKPCRLFDTRAGADNIGARHTPIAGGETFTQQVRGTNGNCAVPSDAVGVAMNVTTVNGTSASFLTIWPADATKPLASSLNWTSGAPPTPNKVDVKLSATGAISLFNNSGNVDVLADVVGYYVDHNHDDRYYTKAEVYAKAEVYSRAEIDNWLDQSDIRTVRMSVNPSNMAAQSGPGLSPVFMTITPINGCVTLESDLGITAVLPLELPIGAHLLNLDIGFWDGSTDQVYRAYLHEYIPHGSLGLETAVRAYTEGGSSSGSSTIVKQHVAVAANTIVDEGEAFNIRFDGLATLFDTNDNGVCSVTVEYTEAPPGGPPPSTTLAPGS